MAELLDVDATWVALCAAQRSSRTHVLSRPSPVPQSPGIYGWWFHTTPDARIDVSNCKTVEGLHLLYVGISPENVGSASHLRKRIRQHYRAKLSRSTLRRSLAALLMDQLGLKPVMEAGRLTLGGAGEDTLSQWMSDNAYVSWHVHSRPWDVEDGIFRLVNLPLNIKDNARNPFRAKLEMARTELGCRANGGDINEGIGLSRKSIESDS